MAISEATKDWIRCQLHSEITNMFYRWGLQESLVGLGIIVEFDYKDMRIRFESPDKDVETFLNTLNVSVNCYSEPEDYAITDYD
jgi:hypothetical protein